MSQYIVTIWTNDLTFRKYSYKVGINDFDSYYASLKQQYDRFTIDYAGEF